MGLAKKIYYFLFHVRGGYGWIAAAGFALRALVLWFARSTLAEQFAPDVPAEHAEQVVFAIATALREMGSAAYTVVYTLICIGLVARYVFRSVQWVQIALIVVGSLALLAILVGIAVWIVRFVQDHKEGKT